MAEMSPQEWGTEYSTHRDWYEWQTGRLRERIIARLADAGIDVFTVESRTKDVGSFVGKIGARNVEKEARFKDPLREVTDIIGVRIVTYYLEDIDKVGAVIQDEFEVDKATEVDKASDEVDRFNYKSVHYIVALSPHSKDSHDWGRFADARAEIQVRTVLQHAWSAVHHKLDYKSEIANPRGLQRRLYILNALFELADVEFSQLRDERMRIEAGYKRGVQSGQLEIPLNEASLTAYIQASRKVAYITDLARQSGADIDRLDSRRLARDIRDLLNVLNWYDIKTVAALNTYLTDNILPVPIPDGFFGDDRRSIEDALTVLIMTEMRADKETYSKIYVQDGWRDFVAGVDAWHRQKDQRR